MVTDIFGITQMTFKAANTLTVGSPRVKEIEDITWLRRDTKFLFEC